MKVGSAFRKKIDPALTLVLVLSLFNAIPLASNPGQPDGALAGLRWLALACLLAGAGGMFLFCHRRSGRLGAVIAALIYAYSPHLMHTLPYGRGDFPELLALWLCFRFCCGALTRCAICRGGANFAAAFALAAALVSADYGLSLVLKAIGVAWLIFETVTQRFNSEAGQVDTRSAALALVALLLGLSGPAMFWLPALQGRASVSEYESIEAAPLESSLRFASLDELLSAPPIQDASALNGPREFRLLGLAQWIAAFVGAGGALRLYILGYRTRHPQAFLGVAFFALLALALIVLMNTAASELWMRLQLHHPWSSPERLLGPTAFCLAIVASANGLWLERLEARYRLGLITLAVALPIVTSFPLLYVPEWRYTGLDVAAEALRLAAPTAGDVSLRDVFSLPAESPMAAAASALSAAILCIVVWRLRFREWTARPYATAPSIARTDFYGILLGGGIALLALAITYREGIAWIKSPPGVALPAQIKRADAFEGGLHLLGYDLASDALRAGDSLMVTAYWGALEETDAYYSTFLQLTGGGSRQVQIEDRSIGARDWNESWRLPVYFLDRFELALPKDLQAGDYDLLIGLFVCDPKTVADCAKGPQAAVEDAEGGLIGPAVRLTTIRVEER